MLASLQVAEAADEPDGLYRWHVTLGGFDPESPLGKVGAGRKATVWPGTSIAFPLARFHAVRCSSTWPHEACSCCHLHGAAHPALRLFAGHAGGGPPLWQLIGAATAGGCSAGSLTALLQLEGAPVLAKVACWLCLHAAAWHCSPLTACCPPLCAGVQAPAAPLLPALRPAVLASLPGAHPQVWQLGGFRKCCSGSGGGSVRCREARGTGNAAGWHAAWPLLQLAHLTIHLPPASAVRWPPTPCSL